VTAGTVGVKQATAPDRLIDALAVENEVGTTVYRQRIALAGTSSVVVANQLVPAAFDQIDMTYTGANVTGVVYRLAGVVVATLTLTYTGDNLTQVIRS